MSDQGEKTCSLCLEEMDMTDQLWKPFMCGHQVCVWCWYCIKGMAEKHEIEVQCPACSIPYNKEKIGGTVANCEKMASSEKKWTSREGKSKTADLRKQLSSAGVVQRNLVYIVGLPLSLADEDLLQRKEYFAQYGKVLKVAMSRTAAGSIQQLADNTCSVSITYSKEEEAVHCIQSVHGFILDGRPLRACFGITKYCLDWLRSVPCTNPDCLYSHEIGSQEDSFTKDDVILVYTRSRVQQITGAITSMQRRSGSGLPPPADDYCKGVAEVDREDTMTSIRKRKQVESSSNEPPKKRPGAARDNDSGSCSTKIFRHLPDPKQKIRKKPRKVNQLDLQSMVKNLESADSNEQLLGIKQVGQLFSEGFISENKGIVKSFFVVAVPLLQNITRTVDSLQSEAAGTLINIISRCSRKPLLVIKHELVQVLLNVLDINRVCVHKVVKVLQKVAFNPESRNYALQHGALDVLLQNLATTDLSLLRKITLTISKFCGGILQPPFNMVKPAVEALRDLVKANVDEEVLSNACKALSYLSGTVDPSFCTSFHIVGVEDFKYNDISLREVVGHFHDVKVLPVLVKLLNKCSSPSITTPAIHTVVNISTTDDKKRVCIPEDVYAAGLIKPLCNLVKKKKMGVAAVAIANAFEGAVDDQLKESLVKCCIGPLCNYMDNDEKLCADVCLKGIEKILELGEAKKASNGGNNVYAQKIKEGVKLENFTNKLARRAKAIVMRYWPSIS